MIYSITTEDNDTGMVDVYFATKGEAVKFLRDNPRIWNWTVPFDRPHAKAGQVPSFSKAVEYKIRAVATPKTVGEWVDLLNEAAMGAGSC